MPAEVNVARLGEPEAEAVKDTFCSLFRTLSILLVFPLEAQDHLKPRQLATVEPLVRVALYDDVELSEKLLAQSTDEATRIFNRAGVTTLWRTCKSSNDTGVPVRECQNPPAVRYLALRIVPRVWNASDSIFGVAFLSETGTGVYGDVFYDSVEKLHRDWGVSLSRLLGHVMAHELGHLLLGSNAHWREGIMRPSWHGDELRRLSKGILLFTPEQAQTIRERLARDPYFETP